MADNVNPKPAAHLDYLDSARGLAAISVMGAHFLVWQVGAEMTTKLLGFPFNGDAAVAFFFVLSGFVLSYKFIVLEKQLDMPKFFVTRLFRLWPAFFVTIAFGSIVLLWRGGFSLRGVFDIFIFDKTSFWEEAILPWSQNHVYGPGWTLVYELKASFFLPFVILLAKKDRRYLYWLALVFYLLTYWIIVFFILGVIISSHFNTFSSPSFRETKWYKYRYPVLLAAILLYSMKIIDALSPYIGLQFYYYSGIASFIFIIYLINSVRLKKILRSKVLIFLGKISFGIYLMHWTLMDEAYVFRDSILRNFHNSDTAFVTVFIIYAACTIILATIVHYTVELPFIRMGKRIAGRMKPGLMA